MDLKIERTAVVDNAVIPKREAALRETAKASLEREAKALKEALCRKVTGQLEGTLRDLKGELDGVVNRVALPRPAGAACSSSSRLRNSHASLNTIHP